MRVGLFTTCLIDLMRPRIAFAALELLERAGCEVIVPSTQTCCGQPGSNSGDREGARRLGEKLITEFEPCDYVVVPSGSCAGMIRVHYPELFIVPTPGCAGAESVAARRRTSPGWRQVDDPERKIMSPEDDAPGEVPTAPGRLRRPAGRLSR